MTFCVAIAIRQAGLKMTAVFYCRRLVMGSKWSDTIENQQLILTLTMSTTLTCTKVSSGLFRSSLGQAASTRRIGQKTVSRSGFYRYCE